MRSVRFPYAVVGGTFDGMHAGHRRMIEATFLHAEIVGIGLTTDALVRGSPKKGGGVAPFNSRYQRLVAHLERYYGSKEWQVVPLNDSNGSILEPKVQAMTVSEETFPVALRANAWRKRHRRLPLSLILVGTLYADDLLPIASRRIRSGVINGEGVRRRPLGIELRGRDTSIQAPGLLEGLGELLPMVRLDPRAKSKELTLRLIPKASGCTLTVEDEMGGFAQSSVRFSRGTSVKDVMPSLIPQLLHEAFLPRWLSRERILPPSVLLSPGPRSASRSLGWDRKVYSPLGVFPFE